MTRHKFFKRLLPIILSAMLLFSVLPVSASANDESTNEVASKIVREVVELREESVKHFLCEDGSYIAVSYAEPVHYEKNGEWLEIDNTLVLSNKNTYVPKSNDLAVSIPQSFSGGEQITATNKGHTISFGVASGNENVALSKTAAVKAVEALPSSIAADVSVETLANAELSSTAIVGKVDTAAQIEAHNSEKTTVDNQAGALVYDKIFPNADLEYIVTGNSIKENVVVYQPQTEYIYTFDMDFGGLTPVAQEDGSYRLIDSAKPDETVFILSAPYMYDANGEESYEVEMSLTENGDNYLLTLTADEAWINSSETTLPVTINQTEDYKFDDVFVIDGLFANSPRVKNELRVGKNLTNITRTYIKISESHNIPYGSKINYAKLILKNKHYYQAPFQDNIDIKLYDCSKVATWSATSVTWNNQPFGNTSGSYSSYNADLLCTIPATDNEGSDYEFNIKTAVENWLETGTNKGFMLASSDESSKTQIDFYSSRADVYKPIIRVNYDIPHLSLTEWVPNQNAATSPAITVSSTKNWTASANQSWISVSPSGGADGDSFTITVTENPDASERKGEVTVMAGTSKIGTVEVIQTGSDPFLSVSNTDLSYKPNEQNITQVVTVNANEGWSFDADVESWFTVSKTADNKLTFELLKANSTFETRSSTVTVTTDSGLEEEITITQFDEVSLYFNKIKPDRSASRKSSSEYNHPLATWAMELSYAAYNYPSGLALPPIPGLFMGDIDYTAADVLHNYGFVDDNPEDDVEENIWEENYVPLVGIAAHTIGHRKITIFDDNIIIGDDNNDTSRTGLDSISISSENISANTTSNGIYSSNDSRSESDNIRQLVVVSVRGSVSLTDWFADILTQFNVEALNFEKGCQEIVDSLYGVKDCNDCNSTDPNCKKCLGYLASEGICNPIILITGHSLGAAVANLTADYLTRKLGADNVYAYTFATPNTVNKANGEESIRHTNIFNILNNNDAVPHFPMNFVVNEWERHGQDFHITMPLNVNWILGVDVALMGAAGHGMPNYYSWLNNLPGTLGKSAEDITVDDLEDMSVDYAVGAIAKIFKVLCPVTVTLYDTDGSIVPFESVKNNAEYPKISDTGIVSWITDDGGKMFLIPYGTENIEARITAYDYGTMTLTVEQPGIGEPIDTITYNNVNLYPDKEFKVNIDEEFSSEDVALVQVETDEDGNEIETEITDLNPYLISASVNVDEIVHGQPCTITIVTHKDAAKTQIQYNGTAATVTFTPEHDWVVSVVPDGDTLIWTIQPVLNRIGEHVFDVNVKVGSTWYYTEKVFALTIT